MDLATKQAIGKGLTYLIACSDPINHRPQETITASAVFQFITDLMAFIKP